jgi:hypothetical protein
VAEKIKQFSFGIDPSAVKKSGQAQSIGLEDRFKGIFNPKECEEKLGWLLSKLEKLIQEDGRMPSVRRGGNHLFRSVYKVVKTFSRFLKLAFVMFNRTRAGGTA